MLLVHALLTGVIFGALCAAYEWLRKLICGARRHLFIEYMFIGAVAASAYYWGGIGQ